MRILGDNRVERIHGTLTLDLGDGRTGSLEVDIDVSDDRSFLEIQNHYDESARDLFRPPTVPARLLSQTLAIHWPVPPHPLRDEERPPPMTIRIPAGEA